MKKIVIAGPSTYGVKNQGDDAMLKVFCDGIRERIPDAVITFLARHPNKRFDKIFGVKSIKNLDHESKEKSKGHWFFGFNHGDSRSHFTKIRKAFSETDLVVIGGNSFMEIFSPEFLKGVSSYSALLSTWSILFGKPYVLYGVATWPINMDLTREYVKFVCNNAQLVTVRENYSREELIRSGAVGSKIQVLEDPVFAIQAVDDRRTALNILRKEKIVLKSDKVLGFAFRHAYWQWGSKQSNYYYKLIARALDSFIEKYGVDVLFIPNCTYNVDEITKDDRNTHRLIFEKMKAKKKAHLIEGEYYLPKFMSIFNLLDMVVSNRRHALIFGAINNKAILALDAGHSWHYSPFLEALTIADQKFSIRDGSIKTLESKIYATWENRQKISEKIAKNLPKLQKRASKHTELIAKLLKSKVSSEK